MRYLRYCMFGLLFSIFLLSTTVVTPDGSNSSNEFSGVESLARALDSIPSSSKSMVDPIIDTNTKAPRPTLVFSFLLGGSGNDELGSNSIAEGPDGSIFVVAGVNSTGLPTTNNALGKSFQGGTFDGLVAQVLPTGEVVWMSYLGGSKEDKALNVVIDSEMNIIIAGTTESGDFPREQAFDSSYNGRRDVFLMKFNWQGEVLWSTFVGGGGEDVPTETVVDSSGNIYVAGYTTSENFPTANGLNKTAAGGGDAFLFKVTDDGALEWATYYGGTNQDMANGLALHQDLIIVAGETFSDDIFLLDPSDSTLNGTSDGFLAYYQSDGNLTKSSYWGGNGPDSIKAVTISGNNTYIAGVTNSTDLTEGLPFNNTRGGGDDAFVAKFGSEGQSLWTTYVGGNKTEVGSDLAVTDDGTVVLTGYTTSLDFPVYQAYDLDLGGGQDAFFTYLSSDGKTLVSTYFGGTAFDSNLATMVGQKGNILFAGQSNSTNVPVTKELSQNSNQGIYLGELTQIQNSFIVNSWGELCIADLPNNKTCEGKFYYPWDILTNSSGHVFVSDYANNRIQIFDASGNFLQQFGSTGAGDGQFHTVNGIDIRSNGEIYVVDRDNHRVQVFNAAGEFVRTFGHQGSQPGNFSVPYGLKINSSGYLYVVDGHNYRIQIFDPSDNYVGEFGSYGFNDSTFRLPHGIDIDEDTGDVYISDWNDHSIKVFDSNGNFIRAWGNPGSEIGQFWNPHRPEIDETTGYVYVSEPGNDRVQVFTKTGEFVTLFAGATDTSSNRFQNPSGLTINSTGYLYLLEQHGHSVNVFRTLDLDPRVNLVLEHPIDYYLLGYVGSNGTNNGQFDGAGGVAVDPTNDDFLVIDINNNRVQVLTHNGIYKDQFGTAGAGNGQFDHPRDVFVNSSGYRFVTDTGNSRIQVFYPNNTFAYSWGSAGTGNGEFNEPTGVFVTETGMAYVTDAGNHRVQYFLQNGTYVDQFGSGPSALPGKLNTPFDILVSESGDILVADMNNNRVAIFNSSHHFVQNFGSFGVGAERFNKPMFMGFDVYKNLAIVDTGNHRVQFFDESLEFISEIEQSSLTWTSSLSGIGFASTNRMFLADSIVNVIYGLDEHSVFAVREPQPWDTIDTSGSILGVAYSPDGQTIASTLMSGQVNLYEVSSGNQTSTLQNHTNPVFSASFSPDSQFLATGGADNNIILWNVGTGIAEKTILAHSAPIYDLEFMNDGKWLVSGSGDRTVKIWNVSSGELVTMFSGHTGGVNSISVSPDESLIASGSWDKTVRIWNISTYLIEQTLQGHVGAISGVEFSPDGTYVVSGSYDGLVKVWDVTTGLETHTFVGHTGRVYSVAFSPDGNQVASVGNDERTIIWDLSSNRPEWLMSGHTGDVWGLQYSPDGTFLLTGGMDGLISIWSIPGDPEGDIDRDGMDDLWEHLNGLSPFAISDKFADNDGDGIINILEHFHKSDPKSIDSDNDGMPDRMELNNKLNLIYNDADHDKDGDGMSNIYEYHMGLDLTNPADADGDLDEDLLSNLEEFRFGSWANQSDTDGDGMRDDVEHMYGLDPWVNDAVEDLDDDGMPNLYEVQKGLNVTGDDSIGDLDNDGMTNLWEYENEFDPADPSDASQDADSDGYTNLEEFLAGTDPHDSSDPPPEPETTTEESNPPVIDPTLVNAGVVALVLGGGAVAGGAVYFKVIRKDDF